MSLRSGRKLAQVALIAQAQEASNTVHQARDGQPAVCGLDLSDDVQAFCDHRTVVIRQRAESQLRLLAHLHGKCYRDRDLSARSAQFPTFNEFLKRTVAFGLREGANAGFLAAEEAIPARLHRRHIEIWPATLAAVESLEAPTHGDVHLKNWYVAKNGEMGLSDWQCATYSHWGRDFAYTIATALTVEDRRAWDRDLLAYYLDQMTEQGGPMLPFEQAWNVYRRQLLPSLAWWTVTLSPAPGMPEMQPRDISIEFVRRIATAIDDLDALHA